MEHLRTKDLSSIFPDDFDLVVQTVFFENTDQNSSIEEYKQNWPAVFRKLFNEIIRSPKKILECFLSDNGFDRSEYRKVIYLKVEEKLPDHINFDVIYLRQETKENKPVLTASWSEHKITKHKSIAEENVKDILALLSVHTEIPQTLMIKNLNAIAYIAGLYNIPHGRWRFMYFSELLDSLNAAKDNKPNEFVPCERHKKVFFAQRSFSGIANFLVFHVVEASIKHLMLERLPEQCNSLEDEVRHELQQSLRMFVESSMRDFTRNLPDKDCYDWLHPTSYADYIDTTYNKGIKLIHPDDMDANRDKLLVIPFSLNSFSALSTITHNDIHAMVYSTLPVFNIKQLIFIIDHLHDQAFYNIPLKVRLEFLSLKLTKYIYQFFKLRQQQINDVHWNKDASRQHEDEILIDFVIFLSQLCEFFYTFLKTHATYQNQDNPELWSVFWEDVLAMDKAFRYICKKLPLALFLYKHLFSSKHLFSHLFSPETYSLEVESIFLVKTHVIFRKLHHAISLEIEEQYFCIHLIHNYLLSPFTLTIRLYAWQVARDKKLKIITGIQPDLIEQKEIACLLFQKLLSKFSFKAWNPDNFPSESTKKMLVKRMENWMLHDIIHYEKNKETYDVARVFIGIIWDNITQHPIKLNVGIAKFMLAHFPEHAHLKSSQSLLRKILIWLDQYRVKSIIATKWFGFSSVVHAPTMNAPERWKEICDAFCYHTSTLLPLCKHYISLHQKEGQLESYELDFFIKKICLLYTSLATWKQELKNSYSHNGHTMLAKDQKKHDGLKKCIEDSSPILSEMTKIVHPFWKSRLEFLEKKSPLLERDIDNFLATWPVLPTGEYSPIQLNGKNNWDLINRAISLKQKVTLAARKI